MRLCILLIALIVEAIALENAQRTARTPQAQIKYNDPNGSKVDWKLFGLQTQGRSQLENSQHKQRGQTEYAYPQQAIQSSVQSQLVQQHQQQQYKGTYQQPQLAQSDPNQYKYSEAQPEVFYKPPVQAQYKPYQESHVPIDAQPAPIQVHYKTFAQPQSRVEAQQDPNQLQYKAYQQSQVQTEAKPEQNQIQYKAYPQQTQAPVQVQQPEPNQVQYRPLSDGPAHVKQLVLENFKPQRPYVDPSAFLYTTNYAVPQQHDQQSANAELAHYEQSSESYEQEQQKIRREYSDAGLQGRIVYKDDYKQREYLQPQSGDYAQVPIEKLPSPPAPKLVFNKNMPSEIQQLLQFQAQLPYDVIANSITYKPKNVFIPKPLPADASGPYQYRSKVYYMNINEEYEPEFDGTKPVQEEQRH